jgi:hypothetical protein
MLFISIISMNETFALVATPEAGWFALYACRETGEAPSLLGKYRGPGYIAKRVQQVAALWGIPSPCLQSIERACVALRPFTVVLASRTPKDLEQRDADARARVKNLNRENVADALSHL